MALLGAGKWCAVNVGLICLEMPSSKIPLVIASGKFCFLDSGSKGPSDYQTGNYEYHKWKHLIFFKSPSLSTSKLMNRS